jgi:hypothetical protein
MLSLFLAPLAVFNLIRYFPALSVKDYGNEECDATFKFLVWGVVALYTVPTLIVSWGSL